MCRKICLGLFLITSLCLMWIDLHANQKCFPDEQTNNESTNYNADWRIRCKIFNIIIVIMIQINYFLFINKLKN